MEGKSLTSVPTSRIETRPEEQSHTSECKSGNYGSLISLNPMKENHELPVRQSSGRKRSPKREKSITPVGSKSFNKEQFVTKIFFQIRLNEVLKICKK